MTFNIIVAMDLVRGIGKDGKLPWHLPGELKHFKDITARTSSKSKNNIVVMGRKTWESLPDKFRPLPGRINLVLTKNDDFSVPQNVFKAKNFLDIFEITKKEPIGDVIENIFVIGGEQIFREAMKRSECQKLYVTHILHSFSCDTFFPPFQKTFQQMTKSEPLREGNVSYYFAEYERDKRFLI